MPLLRPLLLITALGVLVLALGWFSFSYVTALSEVLVANCLR